MTQTRRLVGQSAIVTGASRGIGFGIAKELAREGADLLIVASRQEGLDKAKEELASFGGQVLTLAADLGVRSDCARVVDRAIEAFGMLDVLVNCAAIYKAAPFLEYSPDDFESLIRVNLYGPIQMMQSALPHMVSRNYGRVINVASTAGKWASKNQSAYNISKHGVVGLTRCTAMEFAAHGITVNAICPGMVQTDMSDAAVEEMARVSQSSFDEAKAELMKRIPVGRFLDIAECGHLAVYLASRESQGMTGQSILLDGGMLCV